MSLTQFEWGEVCPECDGLHFSKFRHEAARMINLYRFHFPHGAGWAFNMLENTLSGVYEAGFKDGIESTKPDGVIRGVLKTGPDRPKPEGDRGATEVIIAAAYGRTLVICDRCQSPIKEPA